MWHRLILGIVLALAAYFVVKTFSSESFVTEIPAMAPIVREPPTRGDMSVAASGPNPPNTAPERNLPNVRTPSPEASDPYAESSETADVPERLRHPERSFSPGVIPAQTAIAESAGLAGAVNTSSQAFQQFSPEYVQNGGSFFGNVNALEEENPNYSAF